LFQQLHFVEREDGGGDENGVQCSREEEYDVDVDLVEFVELKK